MRRRPVDMKARIILTLWNDYKSLHKSEILEGEPTIEGFAKWLLQ